MPLSLLSSSLCSGAWMSGSLLLSLLPLACWGQPSPGAPLATPPAPRLAADPQDLLGAALAQPDAHTLAVGAPGAGRVYLLSDDAAAPDPQLLAFPDAGTRLGRGLAAPGDLDGDGHAELLITSQDTVLLLSGPLASPSQAPTAARLVGEGVVVAGFAGGVLASDPRAERILWLSPDLATVQAEVWGERRGGLAGGALASAGDVDGDGVEDAVFGAWGLEGFRGAAYIVRGPLPESLDLGDADARFLGEQAWDVAGVAVAGGADLDGDGRDDVWVGAHGYDDGERLSAGAAYLLRGRVALRGGALRGADARLVGDATDARLGWSLSAGPAGVVVGMPGSGGGWLVTPEGQHRLSGPGGEAVLLGGGAAVVGAPAAGQVWWVPLPGG